jgi:predicted signal transduction protein with EAL and GGDEF domain
VPTTKRGTVVPSGWTYEARHWCTDDFGTGYSLLSYLRRFPFDRIKIVRELGRRRDCDAIVRAAAALGGKPGLAITASPETLLLAGTPAAAGSRAAVGTL